MSGNKNRLSDKQIDRLYGMIEKRSFYAVVAELHRAAGLATVDNIPETTENWGRVYAALGRALELMGRPRLSPSPLIEHEPDLKPRNDRKTRLRYA